MRVLVTGDKHLDLVSEGMPRLEEQARILDRCLELLAETRPDAYVDLGDLFHSPRPSPAAYALALRYGRALDESGVESYLILGNHDKPTRGRDHALVPLAAVFRNVHVVDVPRPGVGGRLLLFPHLTEWEAREVGFESAAAWLDSFAEKGLRNSRLVAPLLAFTHLEVEGARGGEDAVKRDTGLRIPRAVLDSPEIARVYAGHEHGYAVLERVTVVGSALHVTFGEARDPKGAVLVEV